MERRIEEGRSQGEEEKQEALIGKLIFNGGLETGCWNILIGADLFDTGATMEAAAQALRG